MLSFFPRYRMGDPPPRHPATRSSAATATASWKVQSAACLQMNPADAANLRYSRLSEFLLKSGVNIRLKCDVACPLWSHLIWHYNHLGNYDIKVREKGVTIKGVERDPGQQQAPTSPSPSGNCSRAYLTMAQVPTHGHEMSFCPRKHKLNPCIFCDTKVSRSPRAKEKKELRGDGHGWGMGPPWALGH